MEKKTEMIPGSAAKMRPGPSLMGFGKQDSLLKQPKLSSAISKQLKHNMNDVNHSESEVDVSKKGKSDDPPKQTCEVMSKQRRLSFKAPKLRAPSFGKREQGKVITETCSETESKPKQAEVSTETGETERIDESASDERENSGNKTDATGPSKTDSKIPPTTPQNVGLRPDFKRARLEASERRVKRQNDMRLKILELENRMDKLESELDITAEVMHGTLLRATMLQTATKTMLESVKDLSPEEQNQEQRQA